MFKIEEIIIAGGGPIGSYIAVLTSYLGVPVTVYEKRNDYTRTINVKITENFFQKTSLILNRLSNRDQFFTELNNQLKEKNRRIVISELEQKLKDKAVSQGVKYINEEIQSFDQLYQRHRAKNPLILDCTGRHSKLRIAVFGQDSNSMEIIPLESALHINFKAKFNKIDKSLLYSAMKNNNDIKISEVVSSKALEDEYKNVTIPIFISKHLSEIFDKEYPNINREPLLPFRTNKPIPTEIFSTIASIIDPLMMENWTFNFKSMEVKKIEITCGYSKVRSNERFICLGDSAVHLAFYKSLNFGFEHALDLFVALASFVGNSLENISQWDQKYIIDEFEKLHPQLNPIYVRKTVNRNTFVIVTKLLFYGAYKFSLISLETEQLTSNFGVKESEIDRLVTSVNDKLMDWNCLLHEFEAKRFSDIQHIIHSNCRKKQMFDYVSDFIWLNGKSPVKISELLSRVFYGYALFKEDHEYFSKCLYYLRDVYMIERPFDKLAEEIIQNDIKNLVILYKSNFFTNNKVMKHELIKEIINILKIDQILFGEKMYLIKNALVKSESTFTVLSDADVKFIFLNKILEVIVETIETDD